MENYELILISPPKRKHGYFPKGHKPFNKGVPMKEWMDGRKIRKVKKYLEIGRKLGNGKLLAEYNRKKIVAIKDGKLMAFKSMMDAERILRARGIKISARNISSVCNQKQQKVGKYLYIRQKAGGFKWFFADDFENYSHLLTND